MNETCKAIVLKLLPLYVRFPSGDGLTDVVRGFKEKFSIPQCAGSIDGSHVPVTPLIIIIEKDGIRCWCRQL